MRQQLESASHFEILDITDEVVRDYWNELYGLQSPTEDASNDATLQVVFDDLIRSGDAEVLLSPEMRKNSLPMLSPQLRKNSLPLHPCMPSSNSIATPPSSTAFSTTDITGGFTLSPDSGYTHAAATGLLELSGMGHTAPQDLVDMVPLENTMPDATDAINLTPFATIGSPLESLDGIFLPGSAYLQLHSTLRDRMFDTAKSRAVTPEPQPQVSSSLRGIAAPVVNYPELNLIDQPVNTTPIPAIEGLTQEVEYKLWKNWTDEIAPWLDKFDDHSHFGRVIPLLAQHHLHLRFAVLALSARQLERKNTPASQSTSLALYQEAVRQLIPHLDDRTSAVVASCVILCVLEMMSCSPKMWRRHLEGCAALIQSLNITGFSGGLDQALFWCFARMDMCGGLISSEKTLIPVSYWAGNISLPDAIKLFHDSHRPDLYASFAVFLCAHVLELLNSSQLTPRDFAHKWIELFGYIEDWYIHRPAELKPVLELRLAKEDHTRPFPTTLFSNPPAISGNQLYHTAAILMLQKRPKSVHLRQKPRSILWNARQVCSISMSNSHHGCWINAVQPLWIAGQVMSHPAEHRAILETYKRIEQETGWGAEWRAKDLEEFWEDSDNES